VMKRVVFNDVTDRLALAFGNVTQAFGDLMHRLQIDRCAESGASYVLDEPFGCWMGRTIGQRGCRGVNHVDTELDGATRGIWRKSGETMRVQMQRQRAAYRLKCWHQRVNPFRRQQAARILDVDGIDPERNELTSLSHIVIVSVDGAYRVDDSTRGIEADSLGGPNRHLHVAHVVQRVIRRMIAHAVGEDSFRGQLDDVIWKELECEQALTARHHYQRRPL